MIAATMLPWVCVDISMIAKGFQSGETLLAYFCGM